MYLLTLLVEDLVRLPYLRTSGRTEELTLTRPCVNLKKKVTSKSSGQQQIDIRLRVCRDLEFRDFYFILEE